MLGLHTDGKVQGMKYITAVVALGLMVSLSTGLAASAKTRAQCEPSCSSKLEACAIKTANNGCGTSQGCIDGGRDKCKQGGTGFEDAYNACIKTCMAQPE